MVPAVCAGRGGKAGGKGGVGSVCCATATSAPRALLVHCKAEASSTLGMPTALGITECAGHRITCPQACSCAGLSPMLVPQCTAAMARPVPYPPTCMTSSWQVQCSTSNSTPVQLQVVSCPAGLPGLCPGPHLHELQLLRVARCVHLHACGVAPAAGAIVELQAGISDTV
jgi:hypothetical protein